MRHVSAVELTRNIDQLHTKGDAALVFDGDGTLWSGDVAEDIFHFAIGRELLRDEPLDELRRTAREHGLSESGSSTTVARRIFEAYSRGDFPERRVCEVMAWCFAGYRPSELSLLTREALEQAGLAQRLHRSLAPIFELAHARDIHIVIVSASPRFVVEQAAEHWGVPPRDIAASTPATREDRLLPELAYPIPYAETKVGHARALIGGARWLASFGDSGFDWEMLESAEIAVAVQPKPSLLGRLAQLPAAVVLDD